MVESKKFNDRNSALELLRILSMFMIIGLHYLSPNWGGGTLSNDYSLNWFIGRFLRCMFFPSVNVFVCITSWFSINSNKINIKKIINLYLIMLFYGFISLGIGIGLKEISFSWKELLLTVVPFFGGRRWFVETYIILMLLAPFINKVLCSLSKKSYIVLIIVQLLLFSIWPSFFPDAPIVDAGLGILNFVTVYIVIGYIKLHGLKISKLICWIGLIVSILFTFGFSFCSENIWQYCFISNITFAICLFLLVINSKPFYSKFLNGLSATTFGVYLIHLDWILADLIWHKILQCSQFYNSHFFVLHMVASIVGLFIVCALIDWVRALIWRRTVDKILSRSLLLKRGINITCMDGQEINKQ